MRSCLFFVCILIKLDSRIETASSFMREKKYLVVRAINIKVFQVILSFHVDAITFAVLTDRTPPRAMTESLIYNTANGAKFSEAHDPLYHV